MIRCTPVCGPEPVLYVVSVLPLGSWTENDSGVGRPAWSVPVGENRANANTRAGATWGTVTPPSLELEPQAATARASAGRRSAARAARGKCRELISELP